MTWVKQKYYLRLLVSAVRSHGNADRRGMCQVVGMETGGQSPLSIESHSVDDVQVGRYVGRMPGEQYHRYLMAPDQPDNPRSLRVAIIGAPNAGKSTLVNGLLGWKVNAVSSKVHTTRKNTNTFFTEGNTQIAFVDTPGVMTAFHRKKHYCEGRMATDPEESVHGADVVGVIVDVADKWTRNNLHVEILKVLHLHPGVTSFLILNKVDCLKKKTILLETTRRLTDGIVGGQKIQVSSKVQHKPKQTVEKFDSLFSKLEKKYGKMKSVELAEANKVDVVESEKEWLKQFSSQVNKEIVKSHKHYETKQVEGTTCGSEEDQSGAKLRKVETNSALGVDHSNESDGVDVPVDVSSDETFAELTQSPLEPSYQSDFLRQIQAQSHPDIISQPQDRDEAEDDSDWTEKASKLQEATIAAQKEHGWQKFERVFLVSALNGDGIQDIKDYLVSCAKPQPWQFHSSLVTDQDPHDIACMSVWQSVLEYTHGSIPYRVYPEVTYWDIDRNNQLNIIMNLYISSSWEMKQIIGPGGETIKAITARAKQALLDAFQCELRFKLVVQMKKKKK